MEEIVSKKKNKALPRGLFVIYIFVMSYFLFWSDDRSVLSTRMYNLEPFKEIKRFITYREQIGIEAFIINVIGNVVAFMPFGFLIPMITKGKSGFFKTSALCLLFTLMIESIQYIMRLGRFDVDDIIMNTAGGIAGYIIYAIWNRIHSTSK